jgi:hypothetical protein
MCTGKNEDASSKKKSGGHTRNRLTPGVQLRGPLPAASRCSFGPAARVGCSDGMDSSRTMRGIVTRATERSHDVLSMRNA